MMTRKQYRRPHDVLHVAVEAAGGQEAVAKHFNTTRQNVSNRIKRRHWLSHQIRELCELGNNIITVDQVLAYIERARAIEQEVDRLSEQAGQERQQGAEAVGHGG